MKTFSTDASGDIAAAIPLDRTIFLPDVSLSEFLHCFQIKASLRGVPFEDVTVSLRDHILTIAGDSLGTTAQSDDTPSSAVGPFRYNIGLPDDADEDDIECQFGDDELLVTIRRQFS
jgi:HSP20 family molecular chaperone IbpA